MKQGVQVVHAQTLGEAGILHGFATRLGGSSTAYFHRDPRHIDENMEVDENMEGELNLGFTSSDTRGNVQGNRQHLLANVFGENRPLVTLHQVHSGVVHRVGHANASEEVVLHGDGLMTDEPGIVLGIQTADCVPVLVADRQRSVVAAFHAGWRGTLQRIVEAGISRMQEEFGSAPANLRAAIGPSIQQCCYNVGDEVRQQFYKEFSYADALFSRNLKTHLDLAEANKRQLLAAGLSETTIEVIPLCTSCRTDLFFSYRAERGFTGRMLSVIGL